MEYARKLPCSAQVCSWSVNSLALPSTVPQPEGILRQEALGWWATLRRPLPKLVEVLWEGTHDVYSVYGS